MLYGTVVQWNPRKGFGFIRPDRGQDIFFHITALGACEREPLIEIGRPVKFEYEPGTEPKRRSFRKPELDAPPPQEPERPRAKIVELIDKIPGGFINDEVKEEVRVQHHPLARRKKPTWRR
jgi:cold shock CspA family protein